MAPLIGIDCPRYLVDFDTRELPLRWADVLVLGSGVAGLTAALNAAERASVLVVTKADAKESNTLYAQGGIAAVLDPNGEDSHEAHATDTFVAGCGLCDADIVELVVREGTGAVRRLIDGGASFDKADDGSIALTREGGHSAKRILHATGDATGAEVERSLLQRAKANPRIRFLEHAFAVDLVTSNGECQGALVWDDAQGLQFIVARATILAAGGAGRVFRETTNPRVATGDGLAMAYRAGAVLRDMEFMQFHPTTLYVAGAARKLLTEALRGEGAYLVDADGERFMPEVHQLAELAPRDIVARAIVRRLRATGGRGIFLSLQHLDAEHMRARFPGIDKTCASYGIDFTTDRIPVHPSAHYTMGGVQVDQLGATSIPRLYAIGEVSCSGLHGANRLGSNSLLEGLVFGERVGAKAGADAEESLGGLARLPMEANRRPNDRRIEIDIADVLATLRAETWRHIAIERTGEGMRQAAERIKYWSSYVLKEIFAGKRGWELQNLLTVASLMSQCAIWREESRGAHYRDDFPDADDERFKIHSQVLRSTEVTGE
jgi:L-aspartate oxidase